MAVDGVSLVVRAGQSVALIGPSDAGKTTLLLAWYLLLVVGVDQISFWLRRLAR